MANKTKGKREAVRFTLSRKEPLVVVPAVVNGEGPFDFILDTGASMTVISPRVAKLAAVGAGGQRGWAVGANGKSQVTVSRLKSFGVGGVEVKNLRVAIMNLAGVERHGGRRFGGVIGYNFLRRYMVTIDYAARHLYLQPYL